VVLGNETSDMDSTFGSILLAYLYSHLNKDPDVQIVPLINKHFATFKSSFEISYLLEKQFSIPVSNLVFLNQIDIHKISSECNLELILYDHNILNNHWQLFNENVIEVLDHHEDKTA
jgi:inorganic pyrophosphatase/exopolyphosphatase